VIDGINREKKILRRIRDRATITIDTSSITTKQLAEYIISLYDGAREKNRLTVNIKSFGFKYGIPLDTDLLFDVRFIPNPFYVDELKNLSGLDAPVADFVMEREEARVFLEKLEDLSQFLLPIYERDGRTQIIISIGCTGGRHRSVAISEKLAAYLKESGFDCTVLHRDASKTAPR
jgi:UPF0042 nucleotide-binding protein